MPRPRKQHNGRMRQLYLTEEANNELDKQANKSRFASEAIVEKSKRLAEYSRELVERSAILRGTSDRLIEESKKLTGKK